MVLCGNLGSGIRCAVEVKTGCHAGDRRLCRHRPGLHLPHLITQRRRACRLRLPQLEAAMKWITRERPKIDRIACPWLIARFIDHDAEFLYVPGADVLRIAAEQNATPYDVPDVEFTHAGELCSFDAFLKRYHLTDPALQQLAAIVRGADTDRLGLAPESAGLYAISLGLSHNFSDDHEMLVHGMVMYDSLYAWCLRCQKEKHRASA